MARDSLSKHACNISNTHYINVENKSVKKYFIDFVIRMVTKKLEISIFYGWNLTKWLQETLVIPMVCFYLEEKNMKRLPDEEDVLVFSALAYQDRCEQSQIQFLSQEDKARLFADKLP